MVHPTLMIPLDPAMVLRRRKAIRRELIADGRRRTKKRIAILGGSTTSEIAHVLEVFLLDAGIEPELWECDYGRFFEEGAFGSPELDGFQPEVVWVHTTSHNVVGWPSVADDVEHTAALADAEISRFREVWEGLRRRYDCAVVQNNFEPPPGRPLGNLDGCDHRGRSAFTGRLNQRLIEERLRRPYLHIHDLCYLAGWYGLRTWHDQTAWFAYKYAMCHDAIPWLAHSVSRVLRALFGLSKKCLVVDLDNTLWGGVIGDDGLGGIELGPGSPAGEAHAVLQAYIRELSQRGIAVAVCSKNEVNIAREGFSHPHARLSLEDFAAFRASWEPKSEVVPAIAQELNLGEDALVFLDDNPVERAVVGEACTEVEVIQIGSDAAEYARILDEGGWFETLALATEDVMRTAMFRENAKRVEVQKSATNYDEFLSGLEMTAEIGKFSPQSLERITQLINKTNQFNLTTRRYTAAQVGCFTSDPRFVTLAGRLTDRFGDNGLVCVIIAEQRLAEMHVDTWLMSCRVLKRGMEEAMFDELVQQCRERGVRTIVGHYARTRKNGMVALLYEAFGFRRVSGDDQASEWHFDIPTRNQRLNRFIQVNP